MSNKRSNLLREYHLLIKRETEGFSWQIRYDRHATPLKRSLDRYPMQGEAARAGEDALARVRREVAGDPQGD